MCTLSSSLPCDEAQLRSSSTSVASTLGACSKQRGAVLGSVLHARSTSRIRSKVARYTRARFPFGGTTCTPLIVPCSRHFPRSSPRTMSAVWRTLSIVESSTSPGGRSAFESSSCVRRKDCRYTSASAASGRNLELRNMSWLSAAMPMHAKRDACSARALLCM